MNNKYGAKKVTMNGIKFDSKAEANRYLELKLLERAGEIQDLTLQPRFELLPSFKHQGKTIRGVNYTADFQYWEKGIQTVEDTKGFKTRDYVLRSKMFMYKYPEIKFIES